MSSRTCAQSEGVEATIIGQFVPTGRLQLKYHDATVADSGYGFLHGGRPPVVRDATYTPSTSQPLPLPSDSIGLYATICKRSSDR